MSYRICRRPRDASRTWKEYVANNQISILSTHSVGLGVLPHALPDSHLLQVTKGHWAAKLGAGSVLHHRRMYARLGRSPAPTRSLCSPRLGAGCFRSDRATPWVFSVDDNWDDEHHRTPLLALCQALPLYPRSRGAAQVLWEIVTPRENPGTPLSPDGVFLLAPSPRAPAERSVYSTKSQARAHRNSSPLCLGHTMSLKLLLQTRAINRYHTNRKQELRTGGSLQGGSCVRGPAVDLATASKTCRVIVTLCTVSSLASVRTLRTSLWLRWFFNVDTSGSFFFFYTEGLFMCRVQYGAFSNSSLSSNQKTLPFPPSSSSAPAQAPATDCAHVCADSVRKPAVINEALAWLINQSCLCSPRVLID